MNKAMLHWTIWWQRWRKNYIKGICVDDLLSEKEQIEQIRSWWSEYSTYVIGGVVIGAGLLFGINHYQNTKLQAQIDASMAYEALVVEVSSGDLESAEIRADEIATSYTDTSYVAQAALAMARLYMDKNRDQDAADALLAIVEGDSSGNLQNVARLRLARIYLYQDKAQDVVDLLAGEQNSAFAATFGEVLGDAYTALGRTDEAQQAYQEVLLDPLSQGTVDQQLVQWKSLDLPALKPDVIEPVSDALLEAVETAVEESE